MDSSIIVGIIGAAATIVGALIGRSDIIDKVFRRSSIPRLTGRWESSWSENVGDHLTAFKKIITITKQKGSRIHGNITMDVVHPDKKWIVEGDFNGRFLRLFWSPSKEADNKLFLDYGCYFFELEGSGCFTGYAVGFDCVADQTIVCQHQLKRVTLTE